MLHSLHHTEPVRGEALLIDEGALFELVLRLVGFSQASDCILLHDEVLLHVAPGSMFFESQEKEKDIASLFLVPVQRSGQMV
ncbi:MAG: hypothetical protein HY774_02390 [Acidobacteria bacterium]|nr:hypothetical protein [Acidobacteriota bacterium]